MKRNRNGFRLVLLAIIFLLALLAVWFCRMFKPAVRELASAIVTNKASSIIDEAVDELLRTGDIDYSHIVLLEKNIQGNITALKTNVSEINRLKAKTLSIVNERLLGLDSTEIGLPLGNVILPALFADTGPKLPIRILSIGSSDASFHHRLTEVGINQTSHQILLDVTLTMRVLTPIGVEPIVVTTQVMAAETLIMGAVPSSYADLK